VNHSQIVNFLWGIADLIRDTFKRGKYQDVILPFTVLRRLDSVLAPTKTKVLEVEAKFKGKLENLDPQLRRASGFAFYNTSKFDFAKLQADAPDLAKNLRKYIAGFSPNMREVLEKFDFDNTISKLDEAGLLFQVLERFKKVDLHPEAVDNATMGTIFEELIRKFNEALNENPGEHFTPRDVVHLMVDLLLAGDARRIQKSGAVFTVYDPCCGSGGMLTIAKEHITLGVRKNGDILKPPLAPKAEVHLFGQEVNPETFAVCKSDLYMKSKTGEDAERILFGSTLSKDRHAGMNFDYLIANPPYGKDWKRDEDAVDTEHRRGDAGRFGPGLPRISDGQLLFLMHMLAHMKRPEDGGSRAAIIMNGSPLFTGDAGSGESEIRRYVLEHDLLEALVALPEQLFYNTGIATYVWVLSNRKAKERKGKVLLLDASGAEDGSGLFWTSMRKSLGDKRREIPFAKAFEILELLQHAEDGATRSFGTGDKPRIVSKLFPTSHFGFRKITVERPLRLDFQASPERIARLDEQRAFANLTVSKKHGAGKAKDEAEGRALQAKIRAALSQLPARVFLERAAFLAELEAALKKAELKLPAPVKAALVTALSERNEKAEICRDSDGAPEPDPELRDTESVPLSGTVEEYFAREVLPHVPDAWIDTSRRDPKDGEVGLVGYEINFNRYFYRYTPPRPLEEIESDIRTVERDILELLREVAG
jgi:type I restriction enzyme M protein